nr:hypothetical protein [Tanacetum cinerariifolium]
MASFSSVSFITKTIKFLTDYLTKKMSCVTKKISFKSHADGYYNDGNDDYCDIVPLFRLEGDGDDDDGDYDYAPAA